MKSIRKWEKIQNNEVHIWFIDLVNKPFIKDKNIFSKEELKRGDRFMVYEPKTVYLTCRYALRRLLAFYLNITPNEIVFEYNKYGKPFLNQSKHQHKINFNLSHCKNIGCIAITKNSLVGIDVEKTTISLTNMKHTFMTREEIVLYNLNQGNPNHVLYHLWVQKESILKTKGTGFQIIPTNIQGFVRPANLRNEPIYDFYINSYTFHPNVLAVCTTSPVKVKFFSFKEFN